MFAAKEQPGHGSSCHLIALWSLAKSKLIMNYFAVHENYIFKS